MHIRKMSPISLKFFMISFLLMIGLIAIIGSGGGGGDDGSGDTNATGEYRGTYVDPYNSSDTGSWQLQFNQSGSNVTGTISVPGEDPESFIGTLTGSTFTFSGILLDQGTATISGNDISGECESIYGDDFLFSGSIHSGSPLNPVVASTNNDISGYVTLEDGATPTGVHIYLREMPSISTTTSSDGYYFLGGMPDDTYTVYYAKSGYKTTRTVAPFSNTHHTNSDVTLCTGTDIDERLLGNWLEYTDASFTNFAANAIYIVDTCSGGILKELQCSGDKSNENCDWYVSGSNVYDKISQISANNGLGTVLDSTYAPNVGITYSIVGDKLSIFSSVAGSYFYPARYYKYLSYDYLY